MNNIIKMYTCRIWYTYILSTLGFQHYYNIIYALRSSIILNIALYSELYHILLLLL